MLVVCKQKRLANRGGVCYSLTQPRLSVDCVHVFGHAKEMATGLRNIDRPSTIDYCESKNVHEESPGSTWQWQLLTATGGNPRESATETTPPLP